MILERIAGCSMQILTSKKKVDPEEPPMASHIVLW